MDGIAPSTPTGSGIGVGASVGLVVAWILSADGGYGIVVGAGAGLFVGLVRELMASQSPASARERRETEMAW